MLFVFVWRPFAQITDDDSALSKPARCRRLCWSVAGACLQCILNCLVCTVSRHSHRRVHCQTDRARRLISRRELQQRPTFRRSYGRRHRKGGHRPPETCGIGHNLVCMSVSFLRCRPDSELLYRSGEKAMIQSEMANISYFSDISDGELVSATKVKCLLV